ncbi:MAG: post-transcriptional regulator [Bacillota bacterium]|nr:post-transcriptional regulator [Bacillota bacterium]MDP4170697.1 post-transcriptional regulator [Bacillota bacterium]
MNLSTMNDHFRKEVRPALISKLEEFRLLGYDTITEEELWAFLVRKKWKKDKEEKKLHEIVQQILSIKVSDYISFATIESYKKTETSLEDDHEWKELLK